MSLLSFFYALQHDKESNEIATSELHKDPILEDDYPLINKQIVFLRLRYLLSTITFSILFCIFLPTLIFLLLHTEWSYEALVKSNILLLLAVTLLLPVFIQHYLAFTFLISKHHIAYCQYGSIDSKYKTTLPGFRHTYFVSVQFQTEHSFLPDIKCTRKQFRNLHTSDNVLVVSFDGKRAYCLSLTKKK